MEMFTMIITYKYNAFLCRIALRVEYFVVQLEDFDFLLLL